MADHEDGQQTDLENSDDAQPKERWYKKKEVLIPIIISLVSALIAGVSALASFNQANIARDQANIASNQNIVAEQQELVTLVTAIANDPTTVAEQSLTLQSNPAAVSQAATGASYAELADSEEAVNLIGLLNGNGVTATDYYETALGLEPGDSYAQALNYLGKAVNLPSDPRTHASILRTEAQIYYQLGMIPKAVRSDTLAEQAFDHAPDVTKADKENNVADTEFFDAWYLAAVSCSKALAEVSAAEEIFTNNLFAMFEGTTSEYANATKELQYDGCVQKTEAITSPAQGPSTIAGVWEGSYVCSQGVTGLILDMVGVSGGTLSAVFDFFPISGNANVPSGSFTMTGKYSAAGVSLMPGHWINQPRGYSMVALSGGQPSNDSQLFSGAVTSPGCTTFFVHKSTV
jgi:tetratricopeptide (TPR) repeat protein